jgi:hypothetical protein
MSEQKTTACPVIEGLMSVRLSAPDEDHPAYIEGARVALWYRDNPAKKVTP